MDERRETNLTVGPSYTQQARSSSENGKSPR